MLSSISFGSSQPTAQVSIRAPQEAPPSPSPANPNGPNPWGSDSVTLGLKPGAKARSLSKGRAFFILGSADPRAW